MAFLGTVGATRYDPQTFTEAGLKNEQKLIAVSSGTYRPKAEVIVAAEQKEEQERNTKSITITEGSFSKFQTLLESRLPIKKDLGIYGRLDESMFGGRLPRGALRSDLLQAKADEEAAIITAQKIRQDQKRAYETEKLRSEVEAAALRQQLEFLKDMVSQSGAEKWGIGVQPEEREIRALQWEIANLQAQTGVIPELSKAMEDLTYTKTMNPEVLPILEQVRLSAQGAIQNKLKIAGLSLGTLALIGLGAYFILKRK